MGLSLISTNDAPKPASDDRWLKRHAIQIASQLPEDRNSALAVLEYAKVLVDKFIEGDI